MDLDGHLTDSQLPRDLLIQPAAGYESLRDCVAFYPQHMDACLVDGETATAMPGGFYGGWVTHDVVGPFKGGPGSMAW